MEQQIITKNKKLERRKQQLRILSTRDRLVADAGLTIEQRILKLKSGDEKVELKPWMVHQYYKQNKIKRKVISDVYEHKPQDDDKKEKRY